MKFQTALEIIIFIPSLGGGGAEKISVNLANYFYDRKIPVKLLLLNNTGMLVDDVNSNIQIDALNIKLNKFWYFNPIIYISIMKYIIKNSNAIFLSSIRTSNILLGISKKLSNSNNRIVFREANTLNEILQLSKIRKVIYLMLMRLSYKFADHIIANSYDTKSDLIKHKICSSESIEVIPNPVLPSCAYDVYNVDTHPWLKSNDFKTIVSIGRLHEQKGFEFLINTFKLVIEKQENVKLIIIGEGYLKEKLLFQIKKLGLNDSVTILNFKRNIFPYLQDSDLFALTSLWEGFGNVIVEALASGTQVISTNCPGGPSMILENGKYGLLIDRDEILFSENIIKMLNNNLFERNSLIEYSKKFTITNVGKKYLEAIIK